MLGFVFQVPRGVLLTLAQIAAVFFLAGFVTLVGVAPSAEAQQAGAPMMAPEFDEGLDWINTAKAIKLADLRGRIVLLDFWTLC